MERENTMTKRPIVRVAYPAQLLAFAWLAGICGAESIPNEFLNDLKSEEFKVREEAEKNFRDWSREDPGTRVHQVLDQARNAADPEVRQRSHNVLFALAMDDYFNEGEGFIGIQMNAIRAIIPGEDGDPREVITITRVLRDTPAHTAGLRVGDMIASVNGENLPSEGALPSFQNSIRAIKPGTEGIFGIIRDGELLEVKLTLGRRPPEQQARFFGQPMPDLNELAQRDQERFFKEWLKNLEN